MIHDPVLVDQRPLLEAAGSAARLALENEQLQAELRVQLAELRDSRTRIVRAEDDERRRLERDLHDGAQQRLLGSSAAQDKSGRKRGSGRARR
jgi:signal transduction histidine kinase